MPSWKAKAALQHTFSRVPGGHHLNYAFQRHITHGLPISDEKLHTAIENARAHVGALETCSTVPIADGQFFEFGAGWDLHIAQGLYCLGVNRQIIVDIRPLRSADLIFDVAQRLRDEGPPSLPRAPLPAIQSLVEYLPSLGIDYRAPCDAGATGLASGAVDFVTSTNTLEHIPPADIARILTECHRILSSEGAMSFMIDYEDHYSYFDGKVSPYNFLQFSDRRWKWFNPSLHHQNRLRHRDYLELFATAGWKVVSESVTSGTGSDEAAIEHLDLAPRFRDYSVRELAIKRGHVVLKKAV